MELRHLAPSDSRLGTRALASGGIVLEGYASVWNFPSEIIGGEDHGFVEVVTKGAFKRTLRERPDVRALHAHSSEYLLGRTSSGTLELNEDDRGLHFRVKLPDTELIDGLVVQPVKRRDLTGVSIGFGIARGGEKWALIDGRDVRYLSDIELFEISTVAFPAFLATSVDIAGARSRALRASTTATGGLARLNRRLNLAYDFERIHGLRTSMSRIGG